MKRARTLGLAAIMLGLAVLLGTAYAEQPTKTIFPGNGVDGIRIGQKPPANRRCGGSYRDCDVSCDARGRITTITVKVPEYTVVRNGLRVGSGLSEVFRYYGYGQKKSARDGILITYPEQGIDFLVEIGTERVARIIVYSPLPKFPARQYEKYQEKLKQRLK